MKADGKKRQPRDKGSREVAADQQEPVELGADVVVDSMDLLKKQYGLKALSKGLRLPKLKWIVDGLLEEKSPATILGKPKVGKSWASLALSVAVVTGGAFLGHQVKVSGPVIYFVGEGHMAKMSERVAALLKAQGKSLDDLVGNLWITSQQVNLEDEATRADLCAIIREMKPAVVVFDPLARFLVDADENSAKDLRPILNWVQHELCKYTTVVIDHHTDKKGGSARGTGDLYGFVATQMLLKGEGGKSKFTVEVVHRNAEAPDPFDVRLAVQTADRNGVKVLDSADLIVVGTNNPAAQKDIEKIVQTKALITERPDISSSALAAGLGVGYRRAERLAVKAGATMTRPGRAKCWRIPSLTDFKDITRPSKSKGRRATPTTASSVITSPS